VIQVDKYIFCLKDGTKFAEYTEQSIKQNDEWSDETCKKITECAIMYAQSIGYAVKNSIPYY